MSASKPVCLCLCLLIRYLFASPALNMLTQTVVSWLFVLFFFATHNHWYYSKLKHYHKTHLSSRELLKQSVLQQRCYPCVCVLTKKRSTCYSWDLTENTALLQSHTSCILHNQVPTSKHGKHLLKFTQTKSQPFITLPKKCFLESYIRLVGIKAHIVLFSYSPSL